MFDIDFNKKICLQDPNNNQNDPLKYVWIDVCAVCICIALLLRNTKRFKSGLLVSPNPVLFIIRFWGGIFGILCIAIGFYFDRLTIGRFLIHKFRFLTEDFLFFLTFYYIGICLYTAVGGNGKSKIFNLWCGTNLFGSFVVTVGFWTIIAPAGIIVKGLHFNPVDLIGHFLNLVFTVAEYWYTPQIAFDNNILYIMITLLCSYTSVLYVLQKYHFVCWIPYGPLLTDMRFKFAVSLFIVGLFFLMKWCVSRKIQVADVKLTD